MRKKIVKKTAEKPLSYHLGNFFIAIALLSFFLIFYPLITAFFFPPEIKAVASLKGDYITIPKINAQAPVIFNVDSSNPSVYLPVLKVGVAHAKGTSLPGERGSVFIFAHSSGNPLEITNYNTVFLRLGQLKPGDQILITNKEKQFKYKVVAQKVVWPTEVNYLKQKKDQLILQTCWPIGTSLKRLLVFAEPI